MDSNDADDRATIEVGEAKSHKLRSTLLIAAGVFVALAIVGNLLPKPEPEPGKPGGGESAAAAPSTTASTESPSTAAIMPTAMASTTATPDRPAGYVSRETWTQGPWPLTVDEAVLDCQGDSLVTIAARESKYALNAAAAYQTDLPDFEAAIGLPDPDKPGRSLDAGSLIEQGLALCGLSATASPSTPVGGANRPAGLVERATWTDGRWPFTVDVATLLCTKGVGGERVLVVADREMYAVNGTAKSSKLYPPFDVIWLDDPKAPGLKINIGPMIERGRALCEG
jgi:hypothetical protein